MNTAIWLCSWIRRPQAVFFVIFAPAFFGFFVVLFRDASAVTPGVGGHLSTGAILPTLLIALPLQFTTQTGCCHLGPTQLSLTCLGIFWVVLGGSIYSPTWRLQHLERCWNKSHCVLFLSLLTNKNELKKEIFFLRCSLQIKLWRVKSTQITHKC